MKSSTRDAFLSYLFSALTTTVGRKKRRGGRRKLRIVVSSLLFFSPELSPLPSLPHRWMS